MKETIRRSAFLWTILIGTLALPGLGTAQVPTLLKLPPVQVSVIGQGFGSAVGADGTEFNATAFNPALLGKAPHMVEAFGLHLSVSDDVIGLVDYVQNFHFNPDDDFQNITKGYNTSNSSLVNQGLGDVQDLLRHLTNKAVQAGVGDNIAVKVDKHFGVNIYATAHGYSRIWLGALSQSLLNIPLDNNSATNISQSVTVLQNGVQAGIDQYFTSAQQSSPGLSTEIANLKNGTESLDGFKSYVQSNYPSVDPNALGNTIIKELTDEMGVMTTLVYADVVALGTFNIQPFEKEMPGLTLGANLKLVNRRMFYDRIDFNNPDFGDQIKNDLEQDSTRWGFDFGALYELPNVPLDFGLSVLDLFHQGANQTATAGSLLSGFMSDPAPTLVNLSASLHPVPGLRVNAEVDDLLSDSTLFTGANSASRIKMGASYTLAGFFDVRAGFQDQNLGFGAGIMAGFFGLNYAYAMDDLSQAYNHYAQMSFVF